MFESILKIAGLLLTIHMIKTTYFKSEMFSSLRAKLETEREECTGFAWWWRSLLTCPYCLTYWIGLQLVFLMQVLPPGWRVTEAVYSILAGFCAAHVVNQWLPGVAVAAVPPDQKPQRPDNESIEAAKLVVVYGPTSFLIYQANNTAQPVSLRSFWSKDQLLPADNPIPIVAAGHGVCFQDGTQVENHSYELVTGGVLAR